MIDLVTSITNDYDNLRLPEEERDVRYLCYADRPYFDMLPWQIQPTRPMGDYSHESRLPKILMHLHSEAEQSVWMDGCFRPRFVHKFLAEMGSADMVAIQHPRLNAYKEAEYCRREGYGNADAIDEQLGRYKQEGYPGEPFVCGGLIGRRNNGRVQRFNELWWREYYDGQGRDQFALSYAIWKTGTTIKVLKEDVLQNPWFSFHFHAWCHDIADNPLYAQSRQKAADRKARLDELLIEVHVNA